MQSYKTYFLDFFFLLPGQGPKLTTRNLVHGAIPTRYLKGEPDGSQGTEEDEAPESSRPYRSVVRNIDVAPVTSRSCYSNIEEFKKRLSNLVFLKTWDWDPIDGGVILQKHDTDLAPPKFFVYISAELEYTIRVFNFLLPEDHFLYVEWKRSMKNVTAPELVSAIEKYIICGGVEKKSFDGKLIHHSIPYKLKPGEDDFENDDGRPILPFKSLLYCRTYGCEVLTSTETCEECSEFNEKDVTDSTKTNKRKLEPCALSAPIRGSSLEKLQTTVKF